MERLGNDRLADQLICRRLQTMDVTIGSDLRWRRPDGRLIRMTVDLIHDVDGERWFFSRVGESGQFTAVNARYVSVLRP